MYYYLYFTELEHIQMFSVTELICVRVGSGSSFSDSTVTQLGKINKKSKVCVEYLCVEMT